MSSPHGHWVAMSSPRRLVHELMRACERVPIVTVERLMELGDIAAARRQWQQRPAWTAIFAQAFSLVSQATPCLRRSYFDFPWPHLYEHAAPVAAITVERMYEEENAAFINRVPAPHTWRLDDLDAHLRQCKNDPVPTIPSFRRALRLASMPWPVRGWGMWLALHSSGRMRERHCGTFALTSVGADGAGMQTLPTPLTCTIHYGTFDAAHRLTMRLSFDHRVFDGAEGARALAAMEEALHGPILQQLSQPAEAARAA